MASKDRDLERVRGICLALPDTRETPTWGKPHFRVKDKIFCGYELEEHGAVVGFKLEREHARELCLRPGFRPAPYVGHKGWVQLDLAAVSNWDALRELVLESYRLIAPKRSLAMLEAPALEAAAAKVRPARAARKASKARSSSKASHSNKTSKSSKTSKARRRSAK